MLIPIQDYKEDFDEQRKRAINDLLYNANSKEYTNVKSFKQKLIDLLYKFGYSKDNETIFLERKN